MKKDKTLAGILSFIMPGLGQVYCGRIGRGVLLFIGYVIGLFCLVLPGIAVLVWAIVDAVKIAENSK